MGKNLKYEQFERLQRSKVCKTWFSITINLDTETHASNSQGNLIYIGTAIVMGPLPSKQVEDNILIKLSARTSHKIVENRNTSLKITTRKGLYLYTREQQFLFLSNVRKHKLVLESRHWIKNVFTIQKGNTIQIIHTPS